MFFEPLLKKTDKPDGAALTIKVGQNILLDAGNFVSRLDQKEIGDITDIILTHAHLDHIRDLPFFAESLLNSLKNTVTVWGSKETIGIIRKHIFNWQVWPDFTEIPDKKKPVLRFEELRSGKEVSIKGYRVLPVSVSHMEGSLGLIVSKDDSHIVVTGDTAPTQKIWELANALKGEVTVFIETSFPNRLKEMAMKSRHLTPQDLHLELKKIKEGVEILIYHIKSQYFDEISNEINAIRDGRVKILSE